VFAPCTAARTPESTLVINWRKPASAWHSLLTNCIN
jgi:hypothetical protein